MISTDAVLAFDFGEKRVGVAVGSRRVRLAVPLTTIAREDRAGRFADIAALIEQWTPQFLVVGLPTHADGTEHDMTDRARRFARQLEGRYRLPVVLVDERFTSLIAEQLLREAVPQKRRRKEDVDALAAQVILQSYFDTLSDAERSESGEDA